MAEWLYRYEAKGIQSYVLGTNSLKEIAGGSAIIEGFKDKLDETLGCLGLDPHTPEAAKVESVAAGSGTVLFQSEASLRRFASLWPLVVDQTAPGLQLVQAWTRVTDKDDLMRLAIELRGARNHPYVQLPEASPLLARSSRTGLAAVSKADGSLIDRAAKRRLSAGAEGLSGFEFLLEGYEDRALKSASFATDHSHHFATQELVVIHIDGNDMGNAVMRLTDRHAYRAFAAALSAATRSAATAAVREVIAHRTDKERHLREDGRLVLPLRPVVVGGDDVTIILPSKHALRFVKTYVEAFERQTKEHRDALYPEVSGEASEARPAHMTASAGVAFVKAKTPFFAAYALAEELCGWSKSELRGQGPHGVTPSALTYHRVTAGVHTPWSQLRARELASSQEDGQGSLPAALTMAPYLLGEDAGHGDAGHPSLAQLRTLVDAVRQLPRGSFRGWAKTAATDRARADQRWRRLREVAKTSKTLDAATRELGMDAASAWSSEGKTAIFDALVIKTMEGRS